MGDNLDTDDDGDGVADVLDTTPRGAGPAEAEVCYPSAEDDGSGPLDVQVIIGLGRIVASYNCSSTLYRTR